MKFGKLTKERFELVVHLVNQAFAEANNLNEFYWILENRLEGAELPESYKTELKKKQVCASLWGQGKATGIALNPDNLKEVFKEML